jgi:D-inositol-3-phosphate glycosyltransferase
MLAQDSPQKKMRVAMISYHTCPLAAEEGKETGGMNVYVLELSLALAARGHSVDIFTRAQDPSNAPIIQVAEGVRLFHVPAGPEASIPKKELGQFVDVFASEVANIMAKEEHTYQVMHAHYYLSGLVALQLQKLGWKAKLVTTFHTLAIMKNLVGRSEGEKEDEKRLSAEHLLLEKSDCIVAPSQRDMQYMEYLYDAGSNCAQIVPPGVNVGRFAPMSKSDAKSQIKAPKDSRLVMFVGRIEPLKGIDSLLYAVKVLKKQKPERNIAVWIVGGDVSQPVEMWSEELKRLEYVRRQLDLEATVKFVGQQPQDVLPYYYNAADVVVMPSHYESFGMAALEAMACGVPVITSNVAGITGILDDQHSNLVTTVNNPLLLAEQIDKLLTDDTYYQRVSQNVHEKVQNLSWQAVAKKMEKVYESHLKY